MEGDWELKYYTQQAGKGFTNFAGTRYQSGRGFVPFVGRRYQRGHGFFGRIWKGITLPLLKYIGKRGLESAGNILTAAATQPQNIKDILKDEGKRVASQAIEDGSRRAKKFIQEGEGPLVYTYCPPPKNNKRLTFQSPITSRCPSFKPNKRPSIEYPVAPPKPAGSISNKRGSSVVSKSSHSKGKQKSPNKVKIINNCKKNTKKVSKKTPKDKSKKSKYLTFLS